MGIAGMLQIKNSDIFGFSSKNNPGILQDQNKYATFVILANPTAPELCNNQQNCYMPLCFFKFPYPTLHNLVCPVSLQY